MSLIVPTTIHPEREDQPLPYDCFVGIDWGSQQHQVSVLDRDRRRVGERVVDHDGTRSGCQNIKLAIASYDGVPCRNGHTSSLTLRHLGTDTPRSTGLYAGS